MSSVPENSQLLPVNKEDSTFLRAASEAREADGAHTRGSVCVGFLLLDLLQKALLVFTPWRQLSFLVSPWES